MARRGRPPKSKPPGVKRIERKRHEKRIWFDDWTLEEPSLIVREQRSRRRGRPRRSIDEHGDLLRLRICTAAYEVRGLHLEPAIRQAMLILKWRRQSMKEIERVRMIFRRSRRPVP